MDGVETVDISPVIFPPQVVDRISSDVSLQRHLSIGVRPSLRSFEEFRDVNVELDNISHFSADSLKDINNNTLGFNVLKSGKTVVMTTITGGIVEDMLPVNDINFGEQELLALTEKRDDLSRYSTLFPSVQIARGRKNAPPTDEEMTISQKLHDFVLHSGIIPKESLKVNYGIRSVDEDGNLSILYPDELTNGDDFTFEQLSNKRKWSYILYSKTVVFGRSGPVFDLCWNSLIYALKSTKLPRAFIDERAASLKMTVRTRGKSLTVKEAFEVLCDPDRSVSLVLRSTGIGFASNYGIIDLDPEARIPVPDADEEMKNSIEPDSVLLADIDTEAEEANVRSTISIVSDTIGNFKNVTLIGGGSKLTSEMIKKAIALSKYRAGDLENKSRIM